MLYTTLSRAPSFKGRKTRLLAFLFTVLNMVNTVGHMFEGVRPFDWLMFILELAVLLAILWFEGKEAWHQRKIRKRLSSLGPILDEGQRIQHEVPQPSPVQEYGRLEGKVADWVNKVEAWEASTVKFLQRSSPRGAALFTLMVETGVLANPQIVRSALGGPFPIQGVQRDSYQRLTALLKNLRNILEKPEAYF